MPGSRNIWVIGVHLPCVPSPKSRCTSFTFPSLTAVNVVVNGALPSILLILI